MHQAGCGDELSPCPGEVPWLRHPHIVETKQNAFRGRLCFPATLRPMRSSSSDAPSSVPKAKAKVKAKAKAETKAKSRPRKSKESKPEE